MGIPDVAGNWMLQIGGHHLAYNITDMAGTGYPAPHHIAIEPKSSLTISSATYLPFNAWIEMVCAGGIVIRGQTRIVHFGDLLSLHQYFVSMDADYDQASYVSTKVGECEREAAQGLKIRCLSKKI